MKTAPKRSNAASSERLKSGAVPPVASCTAKISAADAMRPTIAAGMLSKDAATCAPSPRAPLLDHADQQLQRDRNGGDEEQRREVARVQPVRVADDLAQVVAAAQVCVHASPRRRKLSSTCRV